VKQWILVEKIKLIILKISRKYVMLQFSLIKRNIFFEEEYGNFSF
jgi:hypothetical protein